MERDFTAGKRLMYARRALNFTLRQLAEKWQEYNQFKEFASTQGLPVTHAVIYNWEKIAEELNLIVPAIQIETHALIRTRSTAPQTGLGRKERRVNIKDAFSAREPEKIEGKRILLVDDVYTTGATVDECSRVLLDHGAKTVDVLTVARAL